MDGVLSDFVGSAYRLMGATPPPLDGTASAENVFETFGGEVWRRIKEQGEAFWDNLEPYPWARALWQFLDEWSSHSLYILTSPGMGRAAQHACPAKLRWCQRILDADSNRVILARSKHVCAHHNAILVDDTPRNIIAWESRGAPALTFPMPWNHLYRDAGVDKLGYVKAALARIKT
jgi:hypothetical protein